MKLLSKTIAIILLMWGVPLTIAMLVDVANPKASNKEGAMVAGIFLGLPPTVLGSWMLIDGQRKARLAADDRLQSTFFQVLQQQNGRITPLSLAMATGVSGQVAKTFLAEKAKEFDANFEVDETGNVIYCFSLGGSGFRPTIAAAPPSSDRQLAGQTETVDVILEAVPSQQKISAIKIVREQTGYGLKEAKDLVEAVPVTIRQSVSLAEAQKLQQQLTAIGATVRIVTK
ncbi:bL12 family ribosomal protein [Pantanalinema sp. GBBB05]|uniref:bL12 family ribosomal protein n=1 Tax=Pantanalinema sp. GBBB05 TaxID=2604139 RepID=UPI001D84FB6B|nr:ribosomal protein L7/L12 [Pantanalinema sp. GBBB05]